MKNKRIEDGKYYVFYRNIELIKSTPKLEMVLVLLVNQKPNRIAFSHEMGSTKLIRIPFSGRKLYNIGETIKVSNNGKTADGLTLMRE